jgi:hypothetical protein
VLVIIFFFCTFFVVKCGDTPIASVSGMELVTGTEIRNTKDTFDVNKENEKIHPNLWAIIALSAAVAGIGLFLLLKKMDAIVGILFSLLGFAALIALHFDIGSGVKDKSELKIDIHTEYRIGYWGALAAFLLAAIFSVLRQMYKAKKKPDTA